jgi:eukaryotic-like serine/threonine-protein kinase
VVGSADYAPPEQLRGVPPHHSADAYGLGVCLYRALTGHLPFEPSAAGTLGALKRSIEPIPSNLPQALAPVASYCLRLLASEPSSRPVLRELTPLLSASRPESAGPARASVAPVPEYAEAQVFAGRGDELASLERAAQRAKHSFALALVEGESGLDKSALVSHFARRLESEAARHWTLSGRCYETEQLSFKAFDGVVDELARRLRDLPDGQVEELLPKKAALLAQLFPVLGSVAAIDAAPRKGLPADPSERRSLALSVFVELLERLARSRPLLVVIDDLQWADQESAALLHSLTLRASALPMLVVTTFRNADEIGEALRAQLEQLETLACASVLRLGSLDAGATAALTEAMLGPEVGAAVIARIARESQGHPLFLRELVEHAKAGDLADRHTPVSLDQALSARIARFEPDARRLLTLVALADKPYPTHVFASALELARATPLAGAAPLRAMLDELLSQGLLRRRSGTGVDCYHDRVRQVALAALDTDQRRRCAAGLAQALDQHQPLETAERARLWDEAGHAETACAAHEAAADAALKTLAFGQAAQHYARALGLSGEADPARRQRLTIQRAHALVRMGNNAEAAALYGAAAELAEGELSVRLRIWAAQNLIQGAQVEAGLCAASELLDELGLPLAKSETTAVRRIVWASARLRWRGTTLGKRATPATPEKRLLLEALTELAQPVTSVMFLQGAALSAEHVRRALEAGDPAHAARALAYEATLRTARNPSVDQTALFERARELAESTGDSAVIAHVLVRRGTACMGRSDFLGSRDWLLAGHELISTQCPDQPWLLATARMNLGSAWHYLGEHRSLAAHAETWVLDAKQRGDSHAYAALSGYGYGSERHLMRGAPAAALDELAEAMAPWPSEPITLNQIGALFGTLDALLYQGGDASWSYLERSRARFQNSALAKSRPLKLALASFSANAAFSAMQGPPSHGDKLAQHVVDQIRTLRRLSTPLSVACADLLAAALSAVRGNWERARLEVRAARTVFESLHHTWRTSALHLEGWLEGGTAGRAKCEEALAEMRAQGWADPQRAVALKLPILHLLAPP